MAHQKDDIRQLFKRYSDNGLNNITCLGRKEEFKEIVSFIEVFQTFERPDGYSKMNNDVLLMEHFEFDSSEYKKGKGNKNRDEIGRIDRKFKESANLNALQDSINCHYHIEHYMANLQRVFKNHYLRIKEYKEHLMQEKIIYEKSNVKVMFLIEDTTILGNLSTDNKIIALPQIDKFLDIFLQSTDLDYVLSFNQVSNDKGIYFLSRNNVKYYREIQLKAENIELIDWNPQVSGFEFQFNNRQSEINA